MKLVCDSCSAKYSVGDDRIAGKVFKIRCKKCGNVMIARGAAPEPATPEAARGEWHAVIAGTQHGPCDIADLVRMAVPDDALVWREGWDDWRVASDVSELRPPAPVSVTAPAPAPALAPVPAPAPVLRAERNESSVLFTLSNLARLAAPAPAPTPASTGQAATSGGAGVTEGSGLIDIRSLARSLAPAANKPSSNIGSDDDLPTFVPAGFVEPAVLLPVARAGQDRRLLFALIASVGLLVVLAGVLIVVLARGRNADAHGALAEATPAPVEPVHVQPPAPPPQQQPVAPIAAPPASPPPPPAASAAPPAPARPSSSPKRTPARTPREPAPSLAPSAPANESCTQVSCIVSGYAEKCCDAFRKEAPRAPASPSSPAPSSGGQLENLDRAALSAGIATIDVHGCSGKGEVRISARVAPEGNVTNVTIKSSPDDALSSCVTAAARKGRFAKTQKGGSFSYVWRF